MKIWLILLLFFTLFFQIIGFISIVFSFLLYLIFRRFYKTSDAKDLFKNKKTEGNIFHQLDEYEVHTQQDIFDIDKLQSYKDILHYGNENEKIELIGMAVFNPSKQYVSLIRTALNDKEETVRILASTSLQKMETTFEDKISKIEDLLSKSVSQEEKDILYFNLIKIYDKYIKSSLIEEFLMDTYIEYIFESFNKISDVKKKKKVYDLYLKLHVKYNKLDIVEEQLKVLSIKNADVIYKFLLLELYYKKSQVSNLLDLLKSIKKDDINNATYIKSYEYWIANVKA